MYKRKIVPTTREVTTILCDSCGSSEYPTEIKVSIDEGEEGEVSFHAHLCFDCLENEDRHFNRWGEIEEFVLKLHLAIGGGRLVAPMMDYEPLSELNLRQRNEEWLGEGE